MALSAASRADGQVSDCQAGEVGDLVVLPAEVEVLLPGVALGFSIEVPTPEAVVPALLVREELVASVRGLDLSGVVGDLPAPLPAPLGLVDWTSAFWPRVELVVVS